VAPLRHHDVIRVSPLTRSKRSCGGHCQRTVYGHSHQPKIETKNGTLFFNPGSAGPRRFGLPITVGRMTAEQGKLRAEIVELSVER
jgi:predicted phosphodiesterase